MARVRASSVKLLPAEADEDIGWALDQVLNRQSLTQKDALSELNNRLRARGIREIKNSSFNRLVVEYRHAGIPRRFRPEAPANTGATQDPLTLLIDARIAEALRQRGISA